MGSGSSWAKTQLKFTAVYIKPELIFGSTWAWSLLWIWPWSFQNFSENHDKLNININYIENRQH